VIGGSGSGFFVSSDGHVLTNAHVVEGCSSILVDGAKAQTINSSVQFDLTILKTEIGQTKTVANFASGPARMNSDVTIAGYPYSGTLGGLNVTRGSVSSLKGLGSDATKMQITAPVQPGNSGGPVVAANGSIVGVVVSKLDAVQMANAYGDIPQNVNFAVRGEIAKLFLSQSGVEPKIFETGGALTPVELAEAAASYTVFIQCN
jgi:serine protease Do